jgi:hypothetical protein
MRDLFPRHGDVSKDGRIFLDVLLNVLTSPLTWLENKKATSSPGVIFLACTVTLVAVGRL